MKDIIEQHGKRYLEYLKGKGFHADTMRQKSRNLDYFLKYLKKRSIKSLSDVTLKILEDYKNYSNKHVSPHTRQRHTKSTINMRLRTASQLFFYLTGNGYIKENPAKKFNIPYETRYLPSYVLSETEMKKLLEAPDIQTKLGLRDRAIFELLYSTAISRQEVAGLNVSDVDLIKNTIALNKDTAKERILPLGRTAGYFISKYLKEGRWSKDLSWRALFVGVYKERLETIDCIIQRYAKKLFPEKHINITAFRNSCAVHMLKRGANILAVQKLLGLTSFQSMEFFIKDMSFDLAKEHKTFHPREKDK